MNHRINNNKINEENIDKNGIFNSNKDDNKNEFK